MQKKIVFKYFFKFHAICVREEKNNFFPNVFPGLQKIVIPFDLQAGYINSPGTGKFRHIR